MPCPPLPGWFADPGLAQVTPARRPRQRLVTLIEMLKSSPRTKHLAQAATAWQILPAVISYTKGG